MAGPVKLTGSHLIAKALQLEGVDYVFTLAGDHILPVLDAMSEMDFRFVDTRHAQAAVHMADAWGRITGQPGVAMYTTPGFANAIPGLAEAWVDAAPVMVLSGQVQRNRGYHDGRSGKGGNPSESASQLIPAIRHHAPHAVLGEMT